MPGEKSANWLFTDFDVTPARRASLETLVPSGVDVRFIAFQEEIAPDTGRRHFQGYVQFRTRVGQREAKRRLGSERVHVEPRRGTHEQATAYCSKDETRAPGTAPFNAGYDLDALISTHNPNYSTPTIHPRVTYSRGLGRILIIAPTITHPHLELD